jgi:ABC-2 type transport system permease protein
MTALISAEWTKIRSVRSTIWTVALTVTLSVGLAYLVGLSFRTNFAHLPADQQKNFDPLFATFYSLTIGQLALVALAVLMVTSEFSTGTIRTTVTVPATFAAAQAGLGPHGTSPTAHGALVAAAGACLYLTLIYLFATGLATLLRGAIPTLGILLPLLFLGSQGLGNIPRMKTIAQHLPDQAGSVIMHLAGQGHDPRFARPYGPWTGIAIMTLWTALALFTGYLAVRRRDA